MVSVTFLGTGDAFHAGGRRSSSYLVTSGEVRVLIDCGPTTPHALHSLDVNPGTINAVLQTHFHGDHVLGLPMLLLHHQILGGPPGGLTIFGPPALEALVYDIYVRVYGKTAKKLREKPEVARFQTAHENVPLKLPGDIGAVTAFPVSHNPESRGYRLDIDGRTLIFTGDTKWDDRLTDAVRGADLLVIDCTWLDEAIGDHLSYAQILEHRDDLPAERIILSHLGPEMHATDRVLELECAFDGMVIDV
jgi:ribonuclease BN (tRNA processing enzyme)